MTQMADNGTSTRVQQLENDLIRLRHNHKLLNIEYTDALKKIDELCAELAQMTAVGPGAPRT